MLLEIYEQKEPRKWDEDYFCRCCERSKPTPPNPPGSDCCSNTWQSELNGVTLQYNQVTKELTHVQKHLDFITTRTARLKLWFDELYSANELARKICQQLEIIEAQVVNICINTEFTVKGIKILYCMIREFYIEVDCLLTRWNCIMNCIKCLNNPNISLTQGIGKVLSDYGTALNTLITTRENLLTLIMAALAMAEQLHWEICDSCGFKRLIIDWQEALHCGVPCVPIVIEEHGHGPVLPEPPDPPCPEIECLFPMLEFPLCNTEYYRKIDRLYKADKRKMEELTVLKQKLTKRQLALAAAKTSLTNALAEVSQTAICS
jgi:hypothetical protein